MSFFSNTKDRISLEMKRLRLRTNPNPSLLSEVVQACMRLKKYEDAAHLAQDGMRQFPDSIIVQEVFRVAQRELARSEVQQAQEEVRKHATPQAYLRLAKNALQILDGVTAVEALQQCLARFPDCAPAHAALSEVFERRHQRDLLASDGRKVLDHMERAQKLDPSDLTVPTRKAHFLAKIGAFGRARVTAEQVVAQDPTIEGIRDLVASLPARRAPEDDEILEDLLVRIEEVGKFPRDQDDATRMRRELTRLCKGLSAMRTSIASERALVIDANGDAWDEQGALSVDAMVNITSNLARTANLATRHCGLGPLRGATLEATNGALALRRGFRCTVGSLLPSGASIRGSQEALAKLLQGAGAAGKEPG